MRIKKTITLVLTKVVKCQSGGKVQQQHKLLREGHLCLCVPTTYRAYRRLHHVTFTFVILSLFIPAVLWKIYVRKVEQAQVLEWKALLVFHKFIPTTCFDL